MADTSQPHSSRCPAWLREGGLYLIVSGVVTVLKYLLLLFLPRAFAFLPMRDFGWPGIEMTLLGETFRWNIFGYDMKRFVKCLFELLTQHRLFFPR